MDTNQNTRLLLKKEVFEIVGSAMAVLNELGHGFHEIPYFVRVHSWFKIA